MQNMQMRQINFCAITLRGLVVMVGGGLGGLVSILLVYVTHNSRNA